MKKNLLFAIALILASTQLSAVTTLMHYWNFNLVTATSMPASDMLFNTSTPASTLDRKITANALTPIAADITLVPPATVAYIAKSNATISIISGWDTTTGSTGNARNGDVAGNCLRPRDAWQNMELVLNIPSTGYQNLTIKYDSQRSGSGPTVNTYYYSVDGGTNWITTGLSTPTNPATIPSTGFALQTIAITDVNADNNANLKFKIWFSDPTNLAGNNRIDNITVEGTPISVTTAINEPEFNKTAINMSPNSTTNGVVHFSEVVDAVVYNVQGRQIKAVAKATDLDTSDLSKGIYVVRINGLVSKKLIIE